MKWRRLLVFGLIPLALIVVYDAAGLAVTSGKILQYERVFDWWHGPISRYTIWIGSIPADVYTGPQSRSVVLAVHGVGETGKNNPALRSIAEALAGSGFRVVVPEFARMKRQNVTPADIDDVVFVLKSLDADVGIICASYGCGPAIIAASRPQVRNRIRFIVTYGSYFDFTETLRFIITGPESPLAYSKWVYMASNADLVQNEQDREQLLCISAQRAYRPSEEWVLTGEDLGDEGRAMLHLFEAQTAAEFDSRLPKMPLLRERLERLSPSHYFAGIRAPLIIVHISSDPCIPSTQSVKMAEAAKALGIPYSLTVLRMYGHIQPAWPDFGLRNFFGFYIPESLRFMRVLHQIVSYA